MKNYIFAILGAGIWMNVNEFIRNELILKASWVSSFKELGLAFPSEPLNGVVWMLWAFIFVTILSLLISKFNVLKSAILAWVLGYVLMWIAMCNMGVLPKDILYLAIPWSCAEVYIAAVMCSKFIKSNA